MNLLFWGLTISMVGKVMLAIGVLWAHAEIAHERRIDQRVLKSFRLELVLTLLGLLLIIIGYVMEVSFYGLTTNMLTCAGETCELEAAAILTR